MQHTDVLRQRLPEAAKDLKLNIQAVLRPEALDASVAWTIAYASALFIEAPDEVVEAFCADALEAGATEAHIDDAHAAVALMRMNTVYYRFRHMIGKG
ncbi:MAG: alkyl hydroperoxide reductase, partial [Planctomycetota bacterium]